MRRPLALGLLAFALGLAPFAHAVGTRTFTLDSIDRLTGGDLKGTSVSSDGVVRAGLLFGNVSLPDASAVFAAHTMPDGSVLLGTSPNGKILKVSGEQVTVVGETGELAVTAFVVGPGGSVYAATIPDGKIFKLGAGKPELFAQLPEAGHVWALVADKTGLFAATGPEGKVFRVESNGTSSVYFRSDESHIVSLATGPSGELYAGSSGKGILYKITGPGRATVLYDFPGEEVKAIAVTKGGELFVLANEYGEPPEPPRRSAAAGRQQSGPSSGSRQKPGKGTLMKFDVNGRPEKMMAHSEFHYLSLALDDAGRPYVGTGAEGRIYTVDENHVVTLVADTDERQIGALSMQGGKGYAVSSDPAVFHRIIASGGNDAVWTSKVLDCGLHARFGKLSWRSSGPVELSTRTGNTQAPDATWSAWSNPLSAPGNIASPAGRYVQVRGRFAKDPKATLSEVVLPFVTDNLRPVVLEVNAGQKGTLSRDSKESLPSSGGDIPKHDNTVKVTWKVDNPDNDALRYRLGFKKEGQDTWHDVLRADELLTKTDYDWDTLSLSEGKYRVRVEASDEAANPPDQVQKHALVSDVFIVDHTPPVVAELHLEGGRLKAKVTDGVGPLVRFEVAIDGRTDFRPLAPADGVFDSAEETIDTPAAPFLPTGPHLVTVRVYDMAGNVATREIQVQTAR